MKAVRIAISMLLAVASFAANADGPSARSLFANSSGVSFYSSAGSQPTNPRATHSTKGSVASAPAYMGMSYTVYQKLADGDVVMVSPKKLFKTDDLISVEVTTNSSGVISAANVNPLGEFSYLGSQSASPGMAVRIPSHGYLRFVGDSGMEKLIFLLSAEPVVKASGVGEEKVATVFTSCETKVTTRSLVIDDEAGNQYRVIRADGTCSVEVAEKEAKTRSLVVDVSENKGYGVVPKKKIDSGEILALGIALRHE